jgi:hypothetical protein
MKPYSLLLVSWLKPDSLEGIRNSNQMLAYGLWSEFSRLSHVTLAYQDSEEPVDVAGPRCDVALLHCFLQRPIFHQIPQLRSRVSGALIGFSELPTPDCDIQFTFLDSGRSDAIHLPCPCLADLLREHTRSKRPGTILLDHAWGPYLKMRSSADWSSRIQEWLLRDDGPAAATGMVYQLDRAGQGGERHNSITPIPEASYRAYLQMTERMETFIVTHRGSYEHSVIDMAARGTRVLVPESDGAPFIPRELVARLGLETFKNRGDLENLLAHPKPPDPQTVLRHCTDMPQVVSIIDRTIQGLLRAAADPQEEARSL